MTKSYNACQNFRITANTLKLLKIINRLEYFSEKSIYIWVTLPDFREGHVENWAKKEQYIIFPGISKRIGPNSPGVLKQALLKLLLLCYLLIDFLQTVVVWKLD